jgi:GNAT superfamily N-acetyltransferase
MTPPSEITSTIIELAETPEVVARLASQVPAQFIRRRSADDRFSVLENICHLRDLENEGYGERIRRVLAEANPSLPDFDGSRLAIEREYQRHDYDSALAEFRAARARNVALLRGLTAEQFQRPGIQQGAGPVTLEKIVLMMQEHDQSHLHDLRLLLREFAQLQV